MKPRPEPEDPAAAQCVVRHLRIGWWSLLLFLSLGIVLEGLHAWKIGWYLDVSNESRRLMFTLAHAHGTLLALVHVGFGLTAQRFPAWRARSRELASRALTSASALIPLGFFSGGCFTHAGDPGLGVLLVPPGALCLFLAVFLTALGARSPPAKSE